MSLRRRLVLGMVVVLVAAIASTDFVLSSSLRSFLYGRLDAQIASAQNQAYDYIETSYARQFATNNKAAEHDPVGWLDLLAVATSPDTARGRLNPVSLSARISPDVYVEVFDSQGRLVFRRPSGSSVHEDPVPVLPASLPVQSVPVGYYQSGRARDIYAPQGPAFAVPVAGHSGPHYQAEAVSVPGGTLVTAVALTPTQQTLASLTHVELLVSAIVIVILVALMLVIIRFGLRPLDDMTDTARAIAAGDMTKRIRRSEERTEVGRLGTALNGMLSQIEAGFRERANSEARLRRFVADASHELRTPLTSIRGYAELLRKGALEDDAGRTRAAERIEHEAARMSLLVDDLLLLARLDQGRPLERSRLDLGQVVAEAVDAARAVQPGRPVSLSAPSAVFVEGDAARLRQVVDNLLRNAAVHTPEGSAVRVAVRDVGSLAVLEVADEGPGLDADQASRVFDRFYRGSEARTGEGTGLGLSIVAALADAHGGRARVETAPGAGAVFVVELPLSLFPAPAPAPAPAPGTESGPSASTQGVRGAPEPDAEGASQGAGSETVGRPAR